MVTNNYFVQTVGDHLDTEILLHKVFFDIMYYTGRRGKEGLRNLCKSSFKVDKTADEKEFIEITFNEKTKKNQGDSTSTSVNALHNDHHIILNKIYTNHQIRKTTATGMRRSGFTLEQIAHITKHVSRPVGRQRLLASL